ncbi:MULTISPECIES: hypothetical protein [Blautia]|uniref:hypothetical protein n=1 Tax=Blautia TaxID=572511 RepID=UPI000D73B7B9|nr:MULTISPECIES: hypothetical protein [Blautia]MBC3533793.1 hypothetical protein [Blautia massiliensis (ex Durand et al. 2017)]PWY58385.1 hypothetical protein DMI82_15720 [Blautia sp. BCRC 81119]
MNAVGIDVSKGKSMVAIMRPFGEISLKKELQDLGVTKIPTSEKIQKRIESLESEQAAVICEKQELQKKHGIIQQNFSALLNVPVMQIPVSKAEKIL